MDIIPVEKEGNILPKVIFKCVRCGPEVWGENK